MVNTVTSQTIIDGSRALVVKIGILGDGSGEESDTVIVDASTFSPAFTNESLRKIEYSLAGFSAALEWNATANVPLVSLIGDHPYFAEYDVGCGSMQIGGIPNNGGVGRTGDILMTTTGLGAGDAGHILLYLYKKDVPVIK